MLSSQFFLLFLFLFFCPMFAHRIVHLVLVSISFDFIFFMLYSWENLLMLTKSKRRVVHDPPIVTGVCRTKRPHRKAINYNHRSSLVVHNVHRSNTYSNGFPACSINPVATSVPPTASNRIYDHSIDVFVSIFVFI